MRTAGVLLVLLWPACSGQQERAPVPVHFGFAGRVITPLEQPLVLSAEPTIFVYATASTLEEEDIPATVESSSPDVVAVVDVSSVGRSEGVGVDARIQARATGEAVLVAKNSAGAVIGQTTLAIRQPDELLVFSPQSVAFLGETDAEPLTTLHLLGEYETTLWFRYRNDGVALHGRAVPQLASSCQTRPSSTEEPMDGIVVRCAEAGSLDVSVGDAGFLMDITVARDVARIELEVRDPRDGGQGTAWPRTFDQDGREVNGVRVSLSSDGYRARLTEPGIVVWGSGRYPHTTAVHYGAASAVLLYHTSEYSPPTERTGCNGTGDAHVLPFVAFLFLRFRRMR
ncbi:MAG: hypothetical protein AB2A00_25615 [Myxococcota bacterium]